MLAKPAMQITGLELQANAIRLNGALSQVLMLTGVASDKPGRRTGIFGVT